MFKKYKVYAVLNSNWKYEYSIEKNDISLICFRTMRTSKHRDSPIRQSHNILIQEQSFPSFNTKECKFQLLKYTKDHSIENQQFTTRRDGTSIAGINYTTSLKIEK
jgi:hypothetical protein